MAKKLTDLDELIVPSGGGNLIHVVDVNDSTDGPSGSSKKQAISNLLRGRVFGKNTNNPGTAANTLILNMSNPISGNHPGNQALAGDFVLFMDETDTRIIIGVAIANCATFPDDLDNTSKFLKFHEGNKLIP